MIEQPENLRLGDLIAKRVPFKVPKYQRAYAWEPDEIEDYLKDLKEIYEAQEGKKEMRHFFGGIVSFEERAPNTATRRVYNVIDGQQRLATFMLTIALLILKLKALATEASSQGDSIIAEAAGSHTEKIRRDFLEYDEVVNVRIEQKARLTLSRADADFFAELLKGHILDQTRESHRRLKGAWDSIQKFITNEIVGNQPLTAAEKLRRLLLLQSCLTEECYVILIVSDSKDEAYRLFSILNDRGKKLEEGDKLHTYTLEFLENHLPEQSRVESSWDAILGYEDSLIDEFLRAYYPSYEGVRAPKRDLADSFLKSSNFFAYNPRPLSINQITEAREIESRVIRMQIEQQAFNDLSDGDWPYNNPTVSLWDQMRLSYLIKVLRHTLCIPLLLSAKHCLQEQQFAELVNLLERFVFRYITIVGAHAGKLGEKYYLHAKKIRDNPNNYQLLQLGQELQDLQQHYAPDEAFMFQMNEHLIYNNRDRSSVNLLIRYFFATLEDYYEWYNRGAANKPSSEKVMTLDLKRLNIEHIYPQNPASPDQALDPQKNLLGNLSIWSPGDNSLAGNEPFSTKKSLYALSNIRLNRYLAALSDWNLAELERRRDILFDMAKKIFTA